ncbi:MAG: AraC family transcriptional regulator [Cytophagales bacterium]|nr:AraC family transcriptional regulator [Cytophagales bacterium]
MKDPKEVLPENSHFLGGYDSMIGSCRVTAKRVGVAFNVPKPLTFDSYSESQDSLLYVQKGKIQYRNEKGDPIQEVKERDVLFLPKHRPIWISFAGDPHAESSSPTSGVTATQFAHSLGNVVQLAENFTEVKRKHFIKISFDVKVFDAVDLFNAMRVFPFTIKDHKKIDRLIYDITEEAFLKSEPGHAFALDKYLEILIMHVLRYILKSKLFLQQVSTTGSVKLKNHRLVKMFSYIRDNLNESIPNYKLAALIDVSEDYVGQYFKAVTGINPQDYIETQRMNKAIELLKTTDRRIQRIGKEVGYKDSSYFCRRFKTMFGISASRFRKRSR